MHLDALQQPRALVHISHVRTLNVQVLRSRAVDAQSAAGLAHDRVFFLVALPQEFLIRRVAHLALVASRVRVHRVHIFHVRLPCFGQQVLHRYQFAILVLIIYGSP